MLMSEFSRQIVRKDKLDPEIFKSNMLRSSDDEVAVIILLDKNIDNSICQHLKNLNLRIKYELPLINAIAVDVPLSMLDKLTQDVNVSYICHDAQVKALMDVSRQAVKADIVNRSGYNGKGIGVAVIDTGVFPHNDLTRDKNRIVAFRDFVNDSSEPYDDEGHGTHVAGIIGGNGQSSNGKYTGIAPEANIIGIKVLNKSGSGNLSDVAAGIQWAVDNKSKHNIRVINLSLGASLSHFYSTDPLIRAVDAAWDSGIIVVTAAGNSGPNPRTINSPGGSRKAITVGASDCKGTVDISDDQIAEFSSRGPTRHQISKPDLVAPGVRINSLATNNKYFPGPGSLIEKATAYKASSGTSMATPIVAGAVALLLQKNPSLTPNQAKDMLLRTAVSLRFNPFAQGRGILDIEALLK